MGYDLPVGTESYATYTDIEDKEGTPAFLSKLETGHDVLAIVDNAYGALFSNDKLLNKAEVDLVGGFLQDARDWGELGLDEPSQRVEAAFSLDNQLEALNAAGFVVFGAIEIRRLEGGVGAPSAWPIAILRVLRASSSEIVNSNTAITSNE